VDVPYRVALHDAGDGAFDRLIELGAIDADRLDDGRLAALMPDWVGRDEIANALDAKEIEVSPAVERDAGSVWILKPRPIRVGHLRIIPADTTAEPGALRLVDSAAFGTGLHPTTALCLEALQEAVQVSRPDAVLDVGTGSGILALAALKMGVPRASGLDLDDEALRVAAENARINRVEQRLQLARGGPESVAGTWPLVLANLLAAPLIEMAPTLVRRVGHQGQLVLSGIPSAIEPDVTYAYRRAGMQRVRTTARAGWTALLLLASW
jgi:ribosomal protein L11 methyltransferase